VSEDFNRELQQVIATAALNPGRFHLVQPGLHRASLKRFPYLILYRQISDGVRVMLVRHHRRDPDIGMERK
jgi:plasmid stabilization system protein ParE